MMAGLEGFDILAFTYADWFASWSTPQQIMSRLTPQNRVLFVDQPRSLLYGLKPRDPQGAGVWSGERLREVQPNLFVYHPPHVFLPTGKLPGKLGRAALQLNGRLIAHQVRRQMRHLGMQCPILWNFSPLHGAATPHLPHTLEIYDICDEWGNYVPDQRGKDLLRWIEARMIRDAHLVFVGTQQGAALRRGMHPELHVVHHGADYGHFAQATSDATALPDDLRGLPRPVIGAVGVMDPARFDSGLIVQLARAHPDWSFVLVGPARADMELGSLNACANVYLTGNRAIAELPAYLKGMDITIIPYKVNEATANIYPLKLQEYLAAGKPVVSAPLPAVQPYAAVVYLAEGPEAFSAALSQALGEDGPERREARQAVARENSWEHRVHEKSEHVLRVLRQQFPVEGAKEE